MISIESMGNNEDSLKNFYFNYGTWEGYPLPHDEYTKISAHDINEACDIFMMVHPNGSPFDRTLNCADIMDEKQFEESLEWHKERGYEYKLGETYSVKQFKGIDLENNRKIYDKADWFIDNHFEFDVSDLSKKNTEDKKMIDFLKKLSKNIRDYKDNKALFKDFGEVLLDSIDFSDMSEKFNNAYDAEVMRKNSECL